MRQMFQIAYGTVERDAAKHSPIQNIYTKVNIEIHMHFSCDTFIKNKLQTTDIIKCSKKNKILQITNAKLKSNDGKHSAL